MKTVLMTLLMIVSVSASASDFNVDDFTLYLVTVREGELQECAEALCSIAKDHGSGGCQVLKLVGIVGVEINEQGLAQAQKLTCVEAIEIDQTVYPLPGLGRSN